MAWTKFGWKPNKEEEYVSEEEYLEIKKEDERDKRIKQANEKWMACKVEVSRIWNFLGCAKTNDLDDLFKAYKNARIRLDEAIKEREEAYNS